MCACEGALTALWWMDGTQVPVCWQLVVLKRRLLWWIDTVEIAGQRFAACHIPCLVLLRLALDGEVQEGDILRPPIALPLHAATAPLMAKNVSPARSTQMQSGRQAGR